MEGRTKVSSMLDDVLLRPMQLAGTSIKNRVALAPVANTGMADGFGMPTDYYVSFVEARARGGVGLIITPNTEVDPRHRVAIGFCSATVAPGYSRLVEAAHMHGARLFLQLAHRGGMADTSVTGIEAVAPTSMESRLYLSKPRELGDSEIVEIVGYFVQAAVRAKQVHFDGVEIHGAHGHDLVAHFMSGNTNRRTGPYGGSFEGRMRFSLEILKGIKDACGEDFPVGIKYSAYEHLEGGITPEEAVRIAEYFAESGMDYVHIATTVWGLGGHEHLSVGPLYSSRVDVIQLASRIKQAVPQLPVIGATNIGMPDEARFALSNLGLDMVAIGRGLIADPDWVVKAARQQETTIQPCIRCNECHRQMAMRRLWRCTVNPYLRLNGGQDRIQPAKHPLRVLVVGGGPGGMQAAITAAERGYTVRLVDANEEPGGNLIAASRPPFKADLVRLLDFFRQRIERARVEVTLGLQLHPEDVAALDVDALIVAVGADPIVPDFSGSHSAFVVTANQAVAEPKALGEKVVVLGCGAVGAETAWYLSLEGHDVTLVDCLPEFELLVDEHANNREVLRWQLSARGIGIHSGCTAQSADPSGLVVRTATGDEERIAADHIVLAVGFQPRRALVDAFRAATAGRIVLDVGDCVRPGCLGDAIHSGHLAAESL